MKKRSTPEKLDNDNPEWTAADIKRAKSFAGLPGLAERFTDEGEAAVGLAASFPLIGSPYK